MTHSPAIIDLLRQKAEHSPSHIRMAGIAFDHKGDILGTASNGFRASQVKPGRFSGNHVEKRLISRYGNLIAKIVLMRIGRAGAILPIEPCPKCRKLLEKYGIKVVTVKAE